MSFLRHVQDLLFPRRCVGCGAYDVWLCAACISTHRSVEYLKNHIDASSTEKFGVDSVTTLGLYSNPMWRVSIGNLKFHGVMECADVFGALLTEVIPVADYTGALLVPIPLHPRRERARGYNQSQLIAEAISRRTGIPIAPDLIRRTQHTRSQTTMDHAARQENVSRAFELYGSVQSQSLTNTLVQTHIILVDDVITTGATACAAADVLRELHPASVHVLAVARGE